MNTSGIFIFEAGSTKTDAIYYYNKKSEYFSFSGYNPNREDTNFALELSSIEIPTNTLIHFYGSGANGEINQQKIRALFKDHQVTISGDSLGAARALLGDSSGIACILGTGGNVVMYDGKSIIEQHGGYGYLIDDYGGGLELSKIIVSKWLNNGFEEHTTNAISNHFNLTKEKFITEFYQKKDLIQLASVCKVLPKLAQMDESLSAAIQDYFNEFINRHVLPICKKHNTYEMNTVGSIGLHFKNWLLISAHNKGINIIKVIAKPIDNLLQYHLSKKWWSLKTVVLSKK